MQAVCKEQGLWVSTPLTSSLSELHTHRAAQASCFSNLTCAGSGPLPLRGAQGAGEQQVPERLRPGRISPPPLRAPQPRWPQPSLLLRSLSGLRGPGSAGTAQSRLSSRIRGARGGP